MFGWVLEQLREAGLANGSTVVVDMTMLFIGIPVSGTLASAAETNLVIPASRELSRCRSRAEPSRNNRGIKGMAPWWRRSAASGAGGAGRTLG